MGLENRKGKGVYFQKALNRKSLTKWKETMNWKEYIHSDPEVLVGKPVIKGTRLAIDFILDLLAQGWTEEQILENYPTLTKESLKALFAFVSECMKEEAVYSFSQKSA